MELSGKKVLVVGAGLSGAAAARFLAARGAVVALNDRKPLEEWSDEARSLKDEGVGLLAGDAPVWLLDQIELVVLSPGVPTKSIPVRYCERAGAEVIGEVELAARHLRGRLVAITGTNGKTTTTTLVGELLQGAGLDAQVGGNIGTPLTSLVESSADDGWTVVEVSSYQLETIRDFHPQVAIVLNLMPDHMDRYETLTDYAAAKHNVFRNQTEGDIAILNADDEIISSWASGLNAHVTLFSVRRELEDGLFLRAGREIVSRTRDGEKVLLAREEIPLRGLHNVENVMAALAAGLACGADPGSMRETVKNFQPVEHRLEFVAEIDGVKFYNDSKATNVDAAVKAFEAFADEPGRVVLILGGRGKNAPYAPLAPLVERKARALVTVGEDADRIEAELKAVAPTIHRATDMADAVRRARMSAKPGDTVLLAPACASFDMFESYEHRGRVFKEAVNKLRNADFGLRIEETEETNAR
ncbi:MAG: UDP-N-acetylmuramoyl-L-alanine--D-glutamate ligase [Acidobacteria bacterium]|nr:UDP-N-acetylmuramoyl-L-alanine--D-glutamate ligase [Acidobacteriota bacterium]MCA1640639.1 UDP-N-acetylmuramoyl-L-alanine--D-glutamate ligase [Acidobacteriota bacterium]